MRRLGIVLRRWGRRILRLRDTPHSIALGLAIGFFFGWGPLYSLHTVLALGAAFLARGNKAAAVAAAWTNNPLTTLPILYLQYLLGTLVLPGGAGGGVWGGLGSLAGALGQASLLHARDSARRVLASAAELGWDALWPTLVGSLVSATLLAIAAYPLTYRAVLWHRRRRHERRDERHRRLAAEGGHLHGPHR